MNKFKVGVLLCLLMWMVAGRAPAAGHRLADNPNPPATPVKLIFIHHSTGGHWLADLDEHDQAGELGQALMVNNYYVSATNYDWGPDSIGSRTDIPNWPEWFTGENSATYLNALYHENGQNIGGFGSWSRLPADPGGENIIIMFKSCFPNSNLEGNPDDPPLSEPNDWEYSVANAQAVYINLLTYFQTRQDKLFVVITAPPLAAGETTAANAANARAFNNWLVNDWLAGYPYHNVAVFDYYNVLTSNGSSTRIDDPSVTDEPHDHARRPDGNHHYWNGSQIVHPQTINNNLSAYPSYSAGPDWYDSHPMTNGQRKATAEFVPLLNVFYNRWKNSSVCVPVAGLSINGPTVGFTNTLTLFTAAVSPVSATTPITYTWSSPPYSGQNSSTAAYRWDTPGAYTLSLWVQNCGGVGSITATHHITISHMRHDINLPLVLKQTN